MREPVAYAGEVKKARKASQKSDVMGFCLCVSLRPEGPEALAKGALRLPPSREGRSLRIISLIVCLT